MPAQPFSCWQWVHPSHSSQGWWQPYHQQQPGCFKQRFQFHSFLFLKYDELVIKADSEWPHSLQPVHLLYPASTGLADVETVSQQQILAFGFLVTLIQSIHALHFRSQWQDEQNELENLRWNKPNGLWDISKIKMHVESQIIAWM